MPPHHKLDAPRAARLAARLRELRAQTVDTHGQPLTQEKVALAAGANRNHYQLLESGLSDRAKGTPSNPTLATLIALCEVYGVQVVDLLADVLDETPPALADLSFGQSSTESRTQTPRPT